MDNKVQKSPVGHFRLHNLIAEVHIRFGRSDDRIKNILKSFFSSGANGIIFYGTFVSVSRQYLI